MSRSQKLRRSACLLVLGGCTTAPGDGYANVAGVVFGPDSLPIATIAVEANCPDFGAHGTTTTDAHGHYTLQLSSAFKLADNTCFVYAPSAAHPVAVGDTILQFAPAGEDHPTFLIDLYPVRQR